VEDILNTEKMAELGTLVEEATRSTEEGVRYFTEPALGTLKRATNKRHHLVFGRRGSGKSSLLRKAGADLTVNRRPIAYVDLEPFKGHTYPNVLLSILISTFTKYEEWLKTAAINPSTKISFWDKYFGKSPTRPSFNRKKSANLAQTFNKVINDLNTLLHSADEMDRIETTRESNHATTTGRLDAKIGLPKSSVSASAEHQEATENAKETQDTYTNKKVDFLHLHIMEYHKIFDELAELSDGDSYLFLDDLYHIKRSDQPDVVDYFHRLAKGHHLWLKIGTIRHRTDWYVASSPPIGVKLGEDADEIDLDVTLEKYQMARKFLFEILSNFAKPLELRVDDFLTDGAKDRLVLASAGVARDFLSIFRRSIDIARERGGGPRGPKIGAEDVNVASGEYDTYKREDFNRDATEDSKVLNDLYDDISIFCLEKINTNCFLINKDSTSANVNLLHGLVDLKLLHLVRSRVTVSGRPGLIYEAYMLDLSRYTGARKQREFKIVEFWKSSSTEILRRASMIYEI
jgi:hypothetical protein